MQYHVIVESDPESGHFTGTVVGLPIVVDASSEEQALQMLREAIRFHLEDEVAPERVHAKVFTLEVEA